MTAEGQQGRTQLRIKTLGTPEISIDGKIIKINRREQRAGLFFLAANVEPVSRSQICDIFWPKDPEQIGRKKLREGLSRLRAALTDPDFVITHDDTVSLNPERVYVDYREYRRIVVPIVGSSEMNTTGKLPDWCYYRLRDVMLTHTGPQFLQGMNLPISLEFENWVSYINHGYILSREKVLQRLADHCITIGNQDECIFWLEWALRTDPMNTDLNFLMITALKERGNIKDAVNHLNILDSIYKSNQNEELPQVLQDLREKLKFVPELEERYTREEIWHGFEAHPPPFKGRERELQTLSNHFHRKGMVLISGEGGSGKTRLVHEFFTRLNIKPRLLICQSKISGDQHPLETLISGMQRMIDTSDLNILPETIRSDMEKIGFGEKTGSSGILDGTRIKKDVFTKQQLFHQLEVLLLLISEVKPVLFVVDDAQWLDQTTIEFLVYLADRDFFKNRALLVLISNQGIANTVLDRFIDLNVVKSNIQTLRLDPLTIVETAQIINNIVGREISNELENWFFRQSGGNPFYIYNLIKDNSITDIERHHQNPDDTSLIPKGIQAIVNLKIVSLSENARKLIEACAILGNKFLLCVVEEFAGLATNDFVAGMEELQRAEIIEFELNAIPIEYCRFVHDLDRLFVLKKLSTLRKMKLHLAAVGAIKKVKGESPEMAATLASHYQAAGEYQMAFLAWCNAGNAAIDQFSQKEAYLAFQTALNLVETLPDHQRSSLICRVCNDWGNYAYDLTDIETSKMLYSTELLYGEQLQNQLLIGSALSGLGRVGEMTGDYEDGIATLRRAFQYLKGAGDENATIEAYSRLGILYELTDRLIDAQKTFEAGLQLIQDDTDITVLDAKINIETQLSLINSMMGWPIKAESYAFKAIDESLLLGRQSSKVQAYTVLAMAQFFSGKILKSIQSVNVVYHLSTRLEFGWWNTLLDLIQARNYLALGYLDESWYFASHAVEGKDEALIPKLVLLSDTVKGDIYRILGDYECAEKYYDKSRQSALKDFESLDQYLRLGMVYFNQGRLSEAVEVTQKVIECANEQGFSSLEILAGVMKEMWLTPEMEESARLQKIETFLAQMQERGLDSDLLNVELMVGYLTMRNREPEQAQNFFLHIVQQAHKINHHLIELWALANLIRINQHDPKLRRDYKIKSGIIFDEMALHATKKPVSSAFRKFRKGIESKE